MLTIQENGGSVPRRIAGVFAVGLCMLITSGCGNDQQPTPTPVAEAPSSEPTESTTGPSDFEVRRSVYWRGEMEGSDGPDQSAYEGAEFEASLEVGQPVEDAASGLPASFSELPDACPGGSQAGIAIPLRLRFENESDVPLKLALRLDFSNSLDPDVHVARKYSDGATNCDYADKSVYVNFPSGVEAGDFGTQELLAVVPDYKSAEFPDGQPEALSRVSMALALLELDSDGRTFPAAAKQTCWTAESDGFGEQSSTATSSSTFVPRLPLADLGDYQATESQVSAVAPEC